MTTAPPPGPDKGEYVAPCPEPVHLIGSGSGLGCVGGLGGRGPVTWSPELCGQNKQGSSVKGWGICAHCHGNHTERGGGGREAGARLPFTDVRPPQPQTWGRLWVAWRPLEANEGWLNCCLPRLGWEIRPWCRTQARLRGLPARDSRGACQSGYAKNTRQR